MSGFSDAFLVGVAIVGVVLMVGAAIVDLWKPEDAQ